MASFGETLRHEREQRNISLREIADTTKISVRHLHALESNDFRFLPGGLYDKSYIRAYAQHVGANADSMVEAYLAEREEQKRNDNGPSRIAQPARSKAAATKLLRTFPPLAILSLGLLSVAVWAFFSYGERDLGRGRAAAGTLGAGGDLHAMPASEPLPAVGVVQAHVVLDRRTSGWLNCDNRLVEMLDGLPAGTSFDFRCERFLMISAADGGALRLALAGERPAPLAADGQSIDRHQILPGGSASSDR